MNVLTLYLIVILHFVFVLFVILTPFLGNNYCLLLHAIIVPFVMVHWYTNNNNCALTTMEKNIRRKLYNEEPDSNDCFTYNLIAPIYDFKNNNNELSVIIYFATFALWGCTLMKLYTNYRNGKLSKLTDLIMH